MLSMIIKRVLRGILTLAIVVCLIFILLRVVPGDPASMLAGPEASEEQLASIRARWGLDLPLWEQFRIYITSLLKGDAGYSFLYGTTDGKQVWLVTDLVKSRLPATIVLASVAMALSILIAVPLGIYTALHPNGVLDNALMVTNFVNISLPNFFVGILLMYAFALRLHILPSGGYEKPSSILLPALTLSAHFSVTLMRMTKTEVTRNMSSDYIRMCRAKGLGKTRSLYVHSLRNVAIPLITLIGLRFGGMLGGSVVTETLFRWPGIGSLLMTAVQARDYPTVQFLVPYIALVFIVINIVVDCLYGILDPRIHREA